MIQMPKRSITRFFIPMIDVLTLLFCIYLLMPMVRNPEQKQQDERRALEEKVRRLEAELAQKSSKEPDMTAQLRSEIEQLRREKIKALKERLAVRVLEIDGDEGKLFVRGGDGQEIKSEAEAHRLIEFDRQKQGAAGKRGAVLPDLVPARPAKRISNARTKAEVRPLVRGRGLELR